MFKKESYLGIEREKGIGNYPVSFFLLQKIKERMRVMTVYPRISNTVSKLGVGIGTVNLPAITT